MKSFVLYSFLLILIYSQANSQAPDWLWSGGSGGNDVDKGQGICVDPGTGDVLVTGFFDSDAINAGSVTLNNTLNNSTSDIYLIRYNQSGAVMWAQSFGGTGVEVGSDVAVDGAGNIVLTGQFNSPTLVFGSVVLTNTGGWDCYIVKFDASGNVLWAVNSDGIEDEIGINIAIDGGNNIAVGGYFRGITFSFGSYSGTILGPNSDDLFVVKYSPSGNSLWVKTAGGTKLENMQGIAIDSNDNIIICGGYTSATLTASGITITNPQVNTYDAFVIKYNSSGLLSFAITLGGVESENAMDIVVDATNSIYISGYYETDVLTIGTSVLINSSTGGFLDAFIAKLNPSGVAQWARGAGGILDEYGSCIALDPSGNIYTAGYYDSDTLSFTTSEMVNNGSFDFYVAKYSPSGSFQWAQNGNCGATDRAEAIAYGNSGELFVTGYFNDDMIFGPGTVTNYGDNDMFVAALDLSTGIREQGTYENELSIYSDGVSGSIIVNSTQKIESIQVYNSSGQNILNTKFSANHISIPISKNGIYFVYVTTESNSFSKKIILMK